MQSIISERGVGREGAMQRGVWEGRERCREGCGKGGSDAERGVGREEAMQRGVWEGREQCREGCGKGGSDAERGVGREGAGIFRGHHDPLM